MKDAKTSQTRLWYRERTEAALGVRGLRSLCESEWCSWTRGSSDWQAFRFEIQHSLTPLGAG